MDPRIQTAVDAASQAVFWSVQTVPEWDRVIDPATRDTVKNAIVRAVQYELHDGRFNCAIFQVEDVKQGGVWCVGMRIPQTAREAVTRNLDELDLGNWRLEITRA